MTTGGSQQPPAARGDDTPADLGARSPGPAGDRFDGAEATTESEALNSIRGETSQRFDAARSVEILAQRLRRLEDGGLRVDTLNLFNAGVTVGGSFNTGAGGRSGGAPDGLTGVVDGHYVADRIRDYVEPGGFAAALAVLREQHLVVLSAPPGTGRDTAALALLDRVGARRRMRTIAVRALPSVEQWLTEDDTSYVVHDVDRAPSTSTASGDVLDDAWLMRVSSALIERRSHLVVTTSVLNGAAVRATRRTDFVVDTLTIPDPVDVFRARLHGSGLPNVEARIDRLLREPDVSRLLHEWPQPRYVIRAADAVGEALRTGSSTARALEAFGNPGALVRELLDHDSDSLDRIAFAMAVAVLEESTYLTLSDAATRLLLELDSTITMPSRVRFRQSMLSGHQWTELVPPDPADGGGSAETVRFRSAMMQPAVLAYVWTEYDGARSAVLSWLRDLAAHRDVEVRARAAAASGVLAIGDLQYALHRYLVAWAGADRFALRQSAALALGVVGAVPEHAERVWTVLHEWVDGLYAGRPRLAATAALAVGGPLGLGDPDRALRLLRRLLEDGSWALLESVALSLLQLVHGGRAGKVLDSLALWSADQDESPLVVKALTSFVVAVSEPVRSGDVGTFTTVETVPAPVPALLSDARAYRDQLPELWGRALDCGPVRPLALDALRAWLRAVDRGGGGYRVVLDLLAGISDRDDRSYQRIEYYLDEWAEDEDDPSDAAAAMVQDLRAAG